METTIGPPNTPTGEGLIYVIIYAAYIIRYIKPSQVGVFGGPMVVSMRYIPLDQEWNYCFVIKKF